jgi:hypothetical protein
MAIPRKVKEAAEKAEALYQQAYAQQEEQPVAQLAQEPEPAPAEPPQEEQVVSQDVQAPEPVQNEQQSAPPAEDKWEHKFKVIEGKYKAEVPRLAAQIRELSQKVEILSAENEELKSRPATPAQSLISPEDREKYGDDLLDVIKRAAKEEIGAKDAEITTLKRQLESINSTTAKQFEVSFYDRLGQLVPDWPVINDDANFHEWLDEYDELTGERRQDLLTKAENSKDADRVARFFTKWKAQKESSKATTQQALAAQVAPDAVKVVKPPAGKRFFTRGEIADFYARARRGEINPKDVVAMEAEIHAASIEGRVR